jgi:hypothetical protein
MALRTDLTTSTPRAEHPGQHNEVNQAVLDLQGKLGVAGGIATLDAVTGYVPDGQLPPTAFTVGSQEVGSQAEQLALNVPRGFIAIRTDENATYIRNAGTAGTMADWNLLRTPTDVVLSVNGQNGAVSLAPADIGAQLDDPDLTAIAALTPADDDVVQRKAGTWTNRTPTQLKADLALTSGDVGLGNVANVTQQPADDDLTAIAALTPANNDVLQRKAGGWTNRTPAQLLADLGISGPTYLSSYKWGVD